MVLALLSGIALKAQMNNTLYFMQGVPQANRVNPAYQPNEGVYVGLPFLAPLRVEINSSSLTYGDLIYEHPGGVDSLITPFHPAGDVEAFLSRLQPLNVAVTDFGSSLISFGFRTEVGYFSADVTSRWDGNIYYPGDVFRLMVEGTQAGQSYQMDGTAAQLAAFDEVGVGWSYELLDELRIGARAKLLFGIGNLSTSQSNLQLRVADNRDWVLASDMHFDASLPFTELSYDEDGRIEDIALKGNLENPKVRDVTSYLFNTQNFGLGLDVGAEYRPLDELQISVSLVDLGYITWKDEVHHMRYSTVRAGEAGEYTFRGLELNPLEIDDDYTFEDWVDSSVNVLADSLSSFLSFQEGGPYTRMLNAKLYAGVSYQLTPGINFGLLSRTDFLSEKVSQQVTASANFTTGRILNFSLSYSYINSYFKNIGFGLSAHLGPVNLYVISDNGLNALFWPGEAPAANLWFGLNLMFGYKDKVDLPLVQ